VMPHDQWCRVSHSRCELRQVQNSQPSFALTLFARWSTVPIAQETPSRGEGAVA
jgi:hypothetical protein